MTECSSKVLSGKALLVEDEAINQKIAQAILEKYGFTPQIADDGYKAVEMAKLARYDLILMDIQLPGINGHEATRMIRQWENQQNTKPAVIFAMTANTSENDRQTYFEAGMDGYITKPIQPDILYTELISWLGHNPKEVKGQQSADEKNISSSGTFARWDYQQALHLIGGDEQLLQDMADLFLRRSQRMYSNVAAALKKRDRQQISDTAHTLKGAVNHFSAHQLSTMALQLEKRALSDDFAVLDDIFQQFLDDVESFETELRCYLVGD